MSIKSLSRPNYCLNGSTGPAKARRSIGNLIGHLLKTRFVLFLVKKNSCECFRGRKGWLNNRTFSASCLRAVQYSWQQVPVLPPLATVTCFPENSCVSFHASHASKSPSLHYPWYTWSNPQFCITVVPIPPSSEEKLETFRFKDEDEYEIWLKVFFAYSQNVDSPESFILPFFTGKVSTVTFSEGGYSLSGSQNDKTSNIW